MNAELDTLIRDAGTIADEARSSFGKLSANQLNWKPSPERWSVAQCLDHLITANRGYFPEIESVAKGTKKTTFWERLPLLPGLAGKMVLKAVDPASARKVKAPKVFHPAQSNISGTIIEEFVAQQGRVIDGMKATSHLDLEHVIITSPVAPVITYSLMDTYRIIVRHERRHLQQAKRVMEEPAFPSV